MHLYYKSIWKKLIVTVDDSHVIELDMKEKMIQITRADFHTPQNSK